MNFTYQENSDYFTNELYKNICPICLFETYSLKRFLFHLQYKHLHSKQCPYCLSKSTSRPDLISHIISCHLEFGKLDKTPIINNVHLPLRFHLPQSTLESAFDNTTANEFIPNSCITSTARETTYQDVSRRNELSKYICPICLFGTYSLKGFEYHLHTHLNLKHCPYCLSESSSSPELISHIISYHLEFDKLEKSSIISNVQLPSLCDMSQSTSESAFTNTVAVEFFVTSGMPSTSSEIAAFTTSDECFIMSDTAIQRIETVISRVVNKHCPVPKPIIRKVTQNTYNCVVCFSESIEVRDYSNNFKSQMEYHRSSSCSACPFVSEYIHHLNTLEKSMNKDDVENTGITKRFRCQECTYKTNFMEELWMHQRRHIETKNRYYCTECPYFTKFEEDVKSHTISHQSDPYRCNTCNYACNNMSKLMNHMESNIIFTQFKCLNCRFLTTYARRIMDHWESLKHTAVKYSKYCDGAIEEAIISTKGGRNEKIRKDDTISINYRLPTSTQDELQTYVPDEWQKYLKDELQRSTQDELQTYIPDELQTNIQEELQQTSLPDEWLTFIEDELQQPHANPFDFLDVISTDIFFGDHQQIDETDEEYIYVNID